MPTPKTPNPADTRIGQRVRLLRMANGLSQENLADRLGLTFQQVQKYEKGVNRIAASRLATIAKIFDVPIASFYDGLEPVNPSGDVIPQIATTRDGVRILTALSQLPAANRRPVVELVESISALLGG